MKHPSPSVILIWLVMVILRLDIILDILGLIMLHLARREVRALSGCRIAPVAKQMKAIKVFHSFNFLPPSPPLMQMGSSILCPGNPRPVNQSSIN